MKAISYVWLSVAGLFVTSFFVKESAQPTFDIWIALIIMGFIVPYYIVYLARKAWDEAGKKKDNAPNIQD